MTPTTRRCARATLALLALSGLGQVLAQDRWRADLLPADNSWRSVPQVFVFNNTTEPETFDPHQTTGVPEYRLISALFETLVTSDPRTLEPRPGVAERWELSPDRLTWTFHLRRDARWSDDRPVTAEDFRGSWRRALLPETGCQHAGQLFPIRNAEAFHRGLFDPVRTLGLPRALEARLVAAGIGYVGELARRRRPDLLRVLGDAAAVSAVEGALASRGVRLGERLPHLPARADLDAMARGERQRFSAVGIEARDARTLVVRLESPCPYFLDLVAFETLAPVPLQVIAAHGKKWVRPEHIVSNGPFRLVEWLPNQRVTLAKNERYWDAGLVKLERIVALPFEDAETAFKLFLTGRIHWLPAVPSERLEELKLMPEYYEQPYLSTYFYRFNTRRPPFDDVRVRKAFSLGFDRETITRDILRGGQVPSTWFCPELPGYQPPRGLTPDPARAQRLLREAGYAVLGEPANGRPFPRVELLYNQSEDHRKVAEAIVWQWRANLGIQVLLRNAEWKVFLDEVQSGNYQLARAGWSGDYLDPNTFLGMWVTGGGNNRTGWSHARYDALIDRAARESDPAQRMRTFREAERILVEEELPIVPIYANVNQGLLSEAVGGWFENIRDHHPFKYLYMRPAPERADEPRGGQAAVGLILLVLALTGLALRGRGPAASTAAQRL